MQKSDLICFEMFNKITHFRRLMNFEDGILLVVNVISNIVILEVIIRINNK